MAVLIFSVIRLAPGDPAEIILGPMATQEEIARPELWVSRVHG